MNVGILLCGGFSNRFDSKILKQMYNYESNPLFTYSLKILIQTLDIIIIIVNSLCFDDIKKIIEEDEELNKYRIYLSVNDINCRMESIYNGLSFIKNNLKDEKISNLIIHDSARPFIKENHISDLLNLMNNEIKYSQYYFTLFNGLLKKSDGRYKEVDRDKFIEICTPICINFELFEFIFTTYMRKENRIMYEFIPLLDLLKIKYKLVIGDKYLRKITKITDII
jgi:2-C-methyl-D-erythritol 4-phosphate cytidylyltransferase